MEMLVEMCLMFVVVMLSITAVGGVVLTLSWVVPAVGELYLGLGTARPTLPHSDSHAAIP